MSAAFTPGPWQTKHDYTVEGLTTVIANVDGEQDCDGSWTYSFDFICTCEDEYGERDKRAVANARLIAAAPELYEALDLLAAVYSELDSPECKRARAALAKARGESA